MNHLVVGAGAIGIWLADRINQADPVARVTLAGRPRFAEAAREGVFVHTGAGVKRQVRCAPAGSLQGLANHGPFDLIALAMKAYGVEGALRDLRAHPELVAANTRMLVLQNGVGSEEKVAAIFGPGRVLPATATVPVAVMAPNHARIERDKGGLGVAAMADGASSELREWCARLGATPFADWRAMKWSKLLLNVVGNASSAIFDLSVAALYADERGFSLERRMLRETVAVINALKLGVVDLPGSPARLLARAVQFLPVMLLRPLLARAAARGRGDKRPSFYYDLANGAGRSEVAYLNGAVAEHGRRLGVPTPANAGLARVLSALVEGRERRDDWRGRLDRIPELTAPG